MPNYAKSDGLTYKRFQAITPHDTTEQTAVSAIQITNDTSGNLVKVTGVDGVAVVMYCLIGVIYPCECVLIWSTGTTADTVIAFQ